MNNNKVSIATKPLVYSAFRYIENKVWNALAEYVDNAVQSFKDHIDILKNINPNGKLRVDINIDIEQDIITITDNAFGITNENYDRAFELANIPLDRKGLNEFGMGMKVSSIWLSDLWTVQTKAYGESEIKTLVFDIHEVTKNQEVELPIITEPANLSEHYTGTNDQPLFCLADLCKVLELTNPSEVKNRLDKDDVQLIDLHALNSSEGITGNSMANFVTESGFYDVILQSSSPRVKPFRKWVTSEVLPAIRKNGGYMSTSNNDTPEEIMARAVMIAQETIKRREQRIEMLEQEKTLLTETIKEAAPKVEYFDKAMSSKSSYTTTQVAQEFGLSAKTLNARLAKMGVQYRQGGAWILYAKYQGNGYTHTVSVPYMMANGEQGTQIQTRWTEKGRKFLHDLLDNK